MHLKILLSSSLSAAALIACVGHVTQSPVQSTINTTAEACKRVDAAIVAADAAVTSGVLKGDAARTTLKGLTAAQLGCVTALSTIQAATTPASGAR